MLSRSRLWSRRGIHHESDHRHADRLTDEAGLKPQQTVVTPAIREPWRAQKAEQETTGEVTECPRPVPGNPAWAVAQTFVPVLGSPARAVGGSDAEDDPDGGERMSSEEAMRLRAMVARCTFLGSDRSDLQCAAKAAPRSFVARHVRDRQKTTRIAKYLNAERRGLVQWFLFGGDDGVIHAFSDSEWAGCFEHLVVHELGGSTTHRQMHTPQVLGHAGGACAFLSRSRVVCGRTL